MKKTALALLAVMALSACSKDESNVLPTDGQYIGCTEYVDEHNNLSHTFCITIENGACTDFVMYNGAERFDYYRPANMHTNGSYPKYTYQINDLTIQAHFTDLESFTANLFGALQTHKDTDYGTIGEVYANIALKVTDVHFKLNNTSLDSNGDGLLDNKH